MNNQLPCTISDSPGNRVATILTKFERLRSNTLFRLGASEIINSK